MIEQPKFNFTSRLRSFRYAIAGIRILIAGQHNAWVHTAITLGVVVLGFVFRLRRLEWCLIIMAIMAVLTAEALNTALEFLCDVASPDFHPLVAKCKDVAAGAVLLSAIGSATIGVLIFGPYLSRWL